MPRAKATIAVPAAPVLEREATIILERIHKEQIPITVEGTAPLITNRWSEKAKEMMLAKQQKKATAGREAKDPEALFTASQYRFEDGRHGFPASAFKAAIVNAASLFDGVTKVALRQALTVVGEGPEQLVEILADEPVMREDMVRNASGVADIRYRASYFPWRAHLVIHHIPRVISAQSIFALADAAGFGGVGEWRPASKTSNTGSYGTFKVAE